MPSEATIFDEPHHQALERLATQALAAKQYEMAFRFADRRCRLAPAPKSHSYLLRAEASFRMGQIRHAIADLDDALAISPNDIQANHRMLAWATGARQQMAARALLSSERDVNVIRRAVEVLSDGDRTAYASMIVLDRNIEGWAVWDVDAPIEVSMISQDNSASYYFDPDPFHPLGSRDLRATSFLLTRPRSGAPQSFTISVDGHRFFSFRAPGNEPMHERNIRRASAAIDPPPTVIVPIYADFAATKACLNSLFAAKKSANFRVVLVDDATPDPQIRRYLSDISVPDVDILTNARNLGFVGSINRALSRVEDGDVIFLNSDTVVPPGFVDRLASTARAASDIGTVIPLSNNGEFSSFPIPHQVNPLGSLKEVTSLDQVAASANPGMAVDIPSGIGFCLYITRRCLDAVGWLSEQYQRGYLEDVDFCLRAREHGFRSVCATSVYVGHKGSRSFGAEKRSLVIRNLDVLDSKFSRYRNECSAFMIADPLRSSRAAIERLLSPAANRPILMVSGTGAVAAVARERTRQMLSANQPTMMLEINHGVPGGIARPVGPDGAAPQNIEFRLARPAEMRSLDEYLKQLGPSRIEICDPLSIPHTLLDLLIDGRAPYDILIADAGLLFPRGWTATEMVGFDSGTGGRGAAAKASLEVKSWRQRWLAVAAGADRITVPCAMAAALVESHLSELKPTLLRQPVRSKRQTSKKVAGGTATLGVTALRASADELESLRALMRPLQQSRPNLSVVVIGETLDDLGLMKFGNCFVTGPVEQSELGRVLTQYGVGFLLTGIGAPLFGHPVEEVASEKGIPIARFDWSRGRFRSSGHDIAIDPALSAFDAAQILVGWTEGN